MNKKICCIFIIWIAFFHSTTVYADVGQVEKGVIDLAPSSETTSTLSGEWEFYWKQLLTPSELKDSQSTPYFIQVPGSWKNQTVNGQNLSSMGYGTYRLRVNIPETHIGEQKALYVNYIGSAYKLWINGKLYKGIGNVGLHKEEEKPLLQSNLIFFEPKKETLEIVIQVSNHSFREGGIIKEIIYGEDRAITWSALTNILPNIIIMGGFLIIGLYHLLIFLIRKSGLSILFLGLGSFAIALRTLMLTEFIVEIILPYLSWSTLLKIEYLSEVSIFIFLVLMMRNLYHQEMNPLLVKVSFMIAFIVSILILGTSTQFSSFIYPYYMFIILIISLYIILYASTMAVMRRKEGAIINLIGIFIINIAAFNDVLNAIMLINTFYMIEFSFLFFFLSQAVIIAKRYNVLFEDNIALTQKLLDLNQSLEEKIEERTQKLNEKNKELEEVHQARTRLLANIAHDIGTPLVGVQTYLQIAKERKINVDFQKVLPQLIDKITYIQKLNNDLFDLSKLESHKLSFHLEKIMIKDFLKEVNHLLQVENESEDTSITFGRVVTAINDKEVFVHIDKLRIKQVIQNYISNATKFNRSQEKIIQLHCYIQNKELVDKQEHELVIEIEDNGVGISPEDLKHIFDRFYKKWRGDNRGSGLGLAIVKEIVEQHNGHVGAHSQMGVGSKFYFTLPIYTE